MEYKKKVKNFSLPNMNTETAQQTIAIETKSAYQMTLNGTQKKNVDRHAFNAMLRASAGRYFTRRTRKIAAIKVHR